jgi:hypothetical protein
MLKFLIFTFAVLIANTNAVYNKLSWSSCSTASQVPAIKIERLSMNPMVYFNLFCFLPIYNFYLISASTSSS